jgi:Uma2 family endonuclease
MRCNVSNVLTRIGPADHGRRMTLEEFEFAEAAEGHLYELSRGVVTVIDVPKPRHLGQIKRIKRQVHRYDDAHPGRIDTIATGSECKILLADLQSERHPDLAIYLDPPPAGDPDHWSRWIPAIVIEVVSPSSRIRDYKEKPEEYLRFGVREYWIFDADKRRMTVLRRSGARWRERIVRPGETYRTRLLPGLEFDVAVVFEGVDTESAE